MRHVHHAHESEDQREATRDDKEERGEGKAVEADDHKLTQILTRLDDQPDEDDDGERRDGDALRAPPPEAATPGVRRSEVGLGSILGPIDPGRATGRRIKRGVRWTAHSLDRY